MRITRFSTLSLLGATLTAVALAPQAQAIVGGSTAPPGRWPFMAALVDRHEKPYWGQTCGGTVIAPRRILTAGHCVSGVKPGNLDVVVSRTRLTGSAGRRIHVTRISLFPGWVSKHQPGLDAAVLTLAGDAGVAPVALSAPGQEATWAPQTTAWVAGWGRLNATASPGDNYYYADRLRELSQPIVGDDACEGVYGAGNNGLIYRPEWSICTGDGLGLSGTCNGDSGGPLAVETPTGWLQVGIVEGGDACAAAGYYDLFTRVDRIRAFALGQLPVGREALRSVDRRRDRRPGR
jgi:secreted trypsin-like serine protease